jgi:hypothetical protein
MKMIFCDGWLVQVGACVLMDRFGFGILARSKCANRWQADKRKDSVSNKIIFIFVRHFDPQYLAHNKAHKPEYTHPWQPPAGRRRL